MKISFEWLKELSGIYWSLSEATEKLARLGFPVEKVQSVGVQVDKVVSVKILEIAKHPNADRLQLATVFDGKNKHSIVCGAPNIAVGQIVPLALPGAKLPGGIEISISKIRGIESSGMLCSERELGLSESHAGILVLPPETPLGKEVSMLLGGRDSVLEVEITPNRPDLLSHRGIARECAALAGKNLKEFKNKSTKASRKSTFKIEILDKSHCSYYSARVIKNVRVQPSPDWLVQRLERCGIRSINNIVDITNYVLLEHGHPLHAFDLATLRGPKIIVRSANEGETLLALDDMKYSLNPSHLIIADAEKPVAIAGVMGGQESGVTEKTIDILLESAVFDSTTVRQTSKKLNLRSESSFRFERGVNVQGAKEASVRATELILDLAGGTLEGFSEVQIGKEKALKIKLSETKLTQLMGKEIPSQKVTDILKRLSVSVMKTSGGWICVPPAFRQDLIEEVDLIEEIARLLGYDSFPSTLPRPISSPVPIEFLVKDFSQTTSFLLGLGISQTITSSMAAEEDAVRLGVSKDFLVPLLNPLSKEESVLRPQLTINLLKAVLNNQNHQQESVAFFEIGKVFYRGKQGPLEKKHLAICVSGNLNTFYWQTKPAPVEIFYLKGILERIAGFIHEKLEIKPSSNISFLHPHQSFEINAQGKNIGRAGMLHPRVQSQYGLNTSIGIIELEIEELSEERAHRTASPLPKYPFVERDVAVILDKEVNWERVSSVVQNAAGELLTDLFPFDLFEGGSLSPNQKSLAFRIRLQHKERTLTDVEITTTVDKIKQQLQQNCGAQLR